MDLQSTYFNFWDILLLDNNVQKILWDFNVFEVDLLQDTVVFYNKSISLIFFFYLNYNNTE